MDKSKETKVDQMWKDLHDKGYFQKDKETFDNYFYAPGAQGYKNRKALYDDLHQKGYLQSPTYEDFARNIGLHAVSNGGSSSTTRTASQQQRPAPKPKPQARTQSAVPKGVVTNGSTPVYYSGDAERDATELSRQRNTSSNSAGGYHPTLQQQIEMQNMFADGQRRIQVQANAGKERINRMSSDLLNTGRFDVDWSGASSNSGIRASGVRRGKNRYNAKTGKQEATYYDEYGNEYDNLGEANVAQTEINEQDSLMDRLDQQMQDIYEQETSRAEEARRSMMDAFGHLPEDSYGAAIAGEQEFRRADPVGSTMRRLMSESPEVRKYLQQMTDYYVKNGEEPSMARQRAVESLRSSVRGHAMQRMMPGNDVSYVLMKAFSGSFPGLITRASTTAGGKDGNGEYDDMASGALEEYGQKKASSTARVLGAVSPLVVDIATGGFAVPSAAGSAAANATTRLLGSAGARVLGIGAEAATRRVAGNLGVQLLGASLGGAVNFGVYNTQSALLGGIASGNVDADTIGKEAWRGVKNGFVFGTVGGAMGKLTGNLTGKAALLGEAATIGVEGGTFMALDAMEGNPITAESIATNFGMALGGRAGHPVKYINNMVARYRGEVGPVKKMRLSDDTYNALKDKYPAISELLHDHGVVSDLARLAKEGTSEDYMSSKERRQTDEQRGKALSKEGDELFNKYEKELEALKNDKNVPWEVVRMAEWVLNGKMMPEPAILGFKPPVQGEDGRWQGVTVDQNGRSIARYDFGKNEKKARKWEKAMLNTTLRNQTVLAEGLAMNKSYADALQEAVNNVAATQEVSPNEVLSIFTKVFNKIAEARKGLKEGEELDFGKITIDEDPLKSDAYKDIYNKVLEEAKNVHPEYDIVSQVKAEILGQQGINIDEVLKKNPSRLTAKERAVLNYYQQEIMGPELANESAQSGRAMEDRYLIGYNSQDGDGSRRASQEKVDAAEQRAIGELPPELMAALEEHPEQVEEILANSGVELSENAKSAAREYAVARAELDGVIQRVRDDIDTAVKQSDELIDSRVHREDQGGDGMVRMATLKLNDEKVYITSGKITINRDGSIDYDNSDKGIVVVGDNGVPRMVDIKEIVEIADPIDPAQLKQENADALRESMAQKAADEIDGVLPFNDGDEYQVVGDDNAAHVIRVINSNEDGLTVNVTVDGGQEVVQMSKEQLQEWANRAREEQMQFADDMEVENEDNAGGIEVGTVYRVDIGDGASHDIEVISDNGDGSVVVSVDGGEAEPMDKAQLEEWAGIAKPKQEQASAQVPQETPAQGTTPTPSVPEASDTGTGIVSDLNVPIPKTKDGKTDYSRATPERTHYNIYNERGLSKERADKIVDATIAKRDAEVAKALEAVEKAKRALEAHQAKDVDADNIDAGMAEEQRLADALRETEDNAAKVQAEADYWRQVKAIEDGKHPVESPKITAPLSDEVNEFGRPFVLSSDGTTIFGEMDAESGLKNAPIKLSLGENTVDEEGVNHGYGLLHIEAGHGKQILNNGFSSIEEFVETVARNYETIREGGIIADNQTYLLEISDGHNNTLFVQLSRDGSYWNVNSAGIFKTKYSRRKPEVYTRPALEPGTNTDSSGVNSGQTEGVTAPAGDSPQTSDDKDITSAQNIQENSGNISEKNQGDITEQRDVESEALPTEEEIALRDGLIDVLRNAGLEVITDDVEGQKVLDAAKQTMLQEMRGWHGSGSEFDRFDHSHMGEGEGAQAYGYGTYVTSVEGIGRSYAKESAKKNPAYYWKEQKIDRASINPLSMAYDVVEREGTIKKAIALVDRFLDNPDAHENWAEVKEILKQSKKSDFTIKPARYLYEVEIPDNNGENYLSWNKTLPKAHRRRVAEVVRKLPGEPEESVMFARYNGGWEQLANMIERNQWSYEEIKERIVQALGGRVADEKRCSELMQEAGFVGIEYPAQFLSGGRSDGAKNHVIFNEDDVKIKDKIQFFKTPDGDVYGFVKDGKIYIDPKIATAETPIHEYSHLWGDALKKTNPKAWERLKETMLGEKDLLEYVKSQYPGLEGDALINEVFSHYSGRRGAERLRAEMEREMAKADGATAKARVAKVFDTIKRALNRFWTMARDLFAGKTRGLDRLTAEDFADMAMSDLLRGFKPEVESNIESKTLMGVHNITAEKLRSAIGLGGLANPSMAVVDTTKGLLNNFGEISLIPGRDMIDKKTGRNAGTFTADAYTPRFPKTHRRLGKGGDKKLKQWLKGLGMRQEMMYNTEEQFNDYYNGFDIQDNALVYPFLHERGLAEDVERYDHNKVSAPYRELIGKYKGDLDVLMEAFDNNEDVMQQVTDIVIDDIVREGVERQEGESFSDWKKRRRALRQEISENYLNVAGYLDRDIAKDILKGECAKYVENSRFNPEATRQAASIYIDKNGLREEYNKYRDEKLGELGAETQMYAGSDREGRSKFKPVTLEGVSKAMKKQGLAGGESSFFSQGPGGIRAQLTPRLTTLEQIRKERGRIQTDIDEILEGYSEELSDTARNMFANDREDLAEVLTSSNMKAKAKELGFEISDATVQYLQDFKKRIIELPTEYFETKFERPVALNEFEAAIVPNDVDPEIREALEGAGLDVRDYDPEKAGDREKVTLDAANDAGNVLFHKVTDKSELDKLNKEKTVTRYRAMVEIDGNLYPPMSVYEGSVLRNPTEIGTWERADETPVEFTEEQKAQMQALDNSNKKGDVVIVPGKIRYHKGSPSGKGTLQYRLKKDNGGDVWAAYNPYFHTSTSGLNDQFSSAYKRPNLVVVEVEIPKSELSSEYKAENAKDAVGDTPWKSGTVNQRLPSDRQRTVTLSRWAKVKRVVPDEEVAKMIAKQMGGTGLEIPFNTVTPSLRDALIKEGVKIGAPEKSNAGRAAFPEYERWKNTAEGKDAIKEEFENLSPEEIEAPATRDEMREWVNGIRTRNDVIAPGIHCCIYDKKDLLRLKGIIPSEIYKKVVNRYKNPRIHGCSIPQLQLVIIFTGKLPNRRYAERNWWHEQTHIVFYLSELRDKEECGRIAFNWLYEQGEIKKEQKDHYEDEDIPSEGASRLATYIFDQHGADGIIYRDFSEDFDGNEKIIKLATAIQNYFRYGETRETETDDNVRQPSTKDTGKEQVGRELNKRRDSSGEGLQPRGNRGNQEEVEGSRVLNEEGNIVTPGRVELNVATMRDPESRRHLQEVMEKEGWSEGAQKEYFNMLEDVADFIIDLGKQFPRLREWNEREITSDKEGEEYNRRYRYYLKNKLMVNRPSFVKNGEYPWNIDLGTLCTKRESFDALVQIITEKGWEQNLGPTQIEAIKSLLQGNGFLTACDVCFNEARRARFLTFANDISFYWNSVRKAAGITDDKAVGDPREFTSEQEKRLKMLAGPNYKSAYQQLVPKELRRDAENDNGLTAAMARRMAKMFLSAPSIAGIAEPGMFLGSANIDKLLRTYGPYTKLEGILKNAWGSGTPKPIEGFNLYDPLSWRDQYDNRPKRPVMDWFFNNGGMRAQSFTDYHPVMFFDYLQLFTDLAVRRLPIHIYTKVPALIKLFGKTGAKFNMSLVPEIVDGVDAEHAGLKPDGKGGWDYAWHEDSFPAEEAFKLREDPNFKGNVGTIAVGVSRNQILKMLDDPTIDMVIPFHGSGMPGSVKIKTGLDKATDYQDVQNTGGKPKKAKDFNFNETLRKLRDPRASAEAYKEWCKKNGYTPKFEEFSDHPNYYKVLEDFTVVETMDDGTLAYREQEPVVMRLPENWKEVLIESLGDKTMQEGLKNQLLGNKELLKGLEKVLSKPRLDGDLRDVVMTSLERALGKGDIASLSENDFFKELEKAYSQEVSPEEAKEKVELLRNSDGIVYGFADGKRIVLNENHFNAETPMHEFTHLWGKVAQKVNPKLWEEGKALLKQTEEWQEVMEDELYADIRDNEDAVARETLARIEQKEMGDLVKDINDPSKKRPTKQGIYAKIRDWLRKMFSSVRSLFAKSNRNLTYDELKKMPLKAVFDEAEAKRFQAAKKAIEETKSTERDVELEVSAGRAEDSGVSDEELANYNAGTNVADAITQGLINLAASNSNNSQLRLNAIRKYGDRLDKLEKLMSKQKAYDKSTVDDIIRLSKMVMGTGFFKDMSAYEVKRLLAAINKGVGAEDLMPIANNVVDVLVKHQLRESKSLLQKLMKEKGSKVDSRGVEVQAGLDIAGQRMMRGFKDGMELDEQGIKDRIADCENRLDSEDEVVKKNALDEYQGLMLAKQWHDTIKASEQEEIGLRNEKRTAEERIYDFSRVPVVDENGNVVMNQDGTMRTTERKTLKPEFKGDVTDEKKQLRKDTEAEIAAIEQSIRDSRIERVTAYSNLMNILAGDIKGSRERAAAWREQQMNRVNEIHHNANSDLEGVDATSQNKTPKGGLLAFNSNNDIVRLLFQPMATFEKIMRFFGRKSHNGEGYLFNRYVRGWVDSTDKEWRSKRAAHEVLDAKVSEIMGKKMRWSDLFKIERNSKYPTIPVEYWDNGELKQDEISQGEALSLYMWNKMQDAKPGLRRMGISEKDIETIKGLIVPRFIELADWVQDEFLPSRRGYYNEVYERMFGAPMAAIENYFPIVRQKRDLPTNDDITQRGMQDVKASTVTGNIMKRVRTGATLDLHTDAFDLVLKHLDDMEKWAAWAEFNRDINTLRNYKRFKNKVLNMNSLEFGAGKELWDAFDKACAIVAGTYGVGSDRGKADALAVNLAKGVTGAKIAFRIYTAAKQLLSLPAFWNGDANLVNSAKWFNPAGAVIAWSWAMKNLPGFSKRWQSRQAGDVRLKDTDSDYAFWRNNIIQLLSRGGMWANALVDGITCAMGARAVYDTKKARYLKDGYSEEQAEKRALQDAAISFNSSQQSSETAFVSPIQSDRTWQSTIFTVFRTASMGYQRRLTTGLRNLKERSKPGYAAESIEFMKKQMMRDGVPEDKAEKAAKRIYRWGGLRAAADVFVFGFVLPFFWNLGPYVLYLLMGDDDDKKDEMLKDASLHSAFGPIEGLTGGNAYSEMGNLIAGNMLSDEDRQNIGQLLKNREFLSMPVSSDVKKLLGNMGKDNPAAWNEAFNILVQAGVGVNPETFTDVYAAIADYCDGDPQTTKELGLLIMRIMQVPQSAIDNLYIDELGMSGKEAKKLNAMEMAERYAKYKKFKNAPLMNWNYSSSESEELMKKYRDRFLDDMSERMETMTDEQLEDNFKNPNDSERRKRVAKAYFKKDGLQDQASKEPSKIWKPETRRSHMRYQRLRTWRDLTEDKLLELKLQQAKNRGDEETVRTINAAKKELGNIKSDLGEVPYTDFEGNIVTVDDVMKDYRELRKEILKELNSQK